MLSLTSSLTYCLPEDGEAGPQRVTDNQVQRALKDIATLKALLGCEEGQIADTLRSLWVDNGAAAVPQLKCPSCKKAQKYSEGNGWTNWFHHVVGCQGCKDATKGTGGLKLGQKRSRQVDDEASAAAAKHAKPNEEDNSDNDESSSNSNNNYNNHNNTPADAAIPDRPSAYTSSSSGEIRDENGRLVAHRTATATAMPPTM